MKLIVLILSLSTTFQLLHTRVQVVYPWAKLAKKTTKTLDVAKLIGKYIVIYGRNYTSDCVTITFSKGKEDEHTKGRVLDADFRKNDVSMLKTTLTQNPYLQGKLSEHWKTDCCTFESPWWFLTPKRQHYDYNMPVIFITNVIRKPVDEEGNKANDSAIADWVILAKDGVNLEDANQTIKENKELLHEVASPELHQFSYKRC